MSGVETINMIVKHVDSNDLYWVDLRPVLGNGETVSSITSVTPSDSALTAASSAVLTVATTVTTTTIDEAGNETTVTIVIPANEGCSFTLSGGTTGAGVSKVKVKFVKSTGKTDSVECLVSVKGTA